MRPTVTINVNNVRVPDEMPIIAPIDTVPVIIIETKVPVELALFLQSTMASTWEFSYRSHS